MNERVLRDGHYIVVIRSTSPEPRTGSFSNLLPFYDIYRADHRENFLVFCQWCGLGGRFERVMPAIANDRLLAEDLADIALRPYPDKSCDGVRNHLLALKVMES